MSILIKVGEIITTCTSLLHFWQQVVPALQVNQLELPFAAVYSVRPDEEASDTVRPSSSGSRRLVNSVKRCTFEGSTGVPKGHPAIAHSLDLLHGSDGFIPYFRAAAATGKPIALHVDDGTLPADLLQGITCAPFGDLCRGVVVCPIKPTTETEDIGGFLVLGLHPRRPYDQDYQVFIELLVKSFATSMASVTLLEAEVQKGVRAAEQAALDQAKLQEELAVKVKHAERLEMQFTHFADSAPIGINIMSAAGDLLYANDAWFEVTLCPREGMRPMEWMNVFHMEEVQNAERMWKTLVEDKAAVTFEARLRKTWIPSGGVEGDVVHNTWVSTSS